MENEISEGDILFAEAYEAVNEHTAAQQYQARFHDELKSSRESLDIAVLDVEEAASKLKDFRDLLETVCRALEDVSKRTIVLKRRADDAHDRTRSHSERCRRATKDHLMAEEVLIHSLGCLGDLGKGRGKCCTCSVLWSPGHRQQRKRSICQRPST